MRPKSTKIQRTCQHCEHEFAARQSAVAKGQGTFCSRACRFEEMRQKRIPCICQQCGITFFVRPSAPKHGQGIFCSNACQGLASRHPKSTIAERFWPKISKTDTCWIWTGGRGSSGYGNVLIGNRRNAAHRIAYELTYGPIPEGMVICHHCDNPPCCNPAHLFLGTRADNNADKVAKGRQPNGETAGPSRLTMEQVRMIRSRYAAGESRKDLAQAFGVVLGTIRKIVVYETWRNVH